MKRNTFWPLAPYLERACSTVYIPHTASRKVQYTKSTRGRWEKGAVSGGAGEKGGGRGATREKEGGIGGRKRGMREKEGGRARRSREEEGGGGRNREEEGGR